METRHSPRPTIASALLFLGVGLLLLCGMEAMSDTGLPGMPRIWHQNLLLWWVLAGGLIAFGCGVLAPRRPDAIEWHPSRPGIRFRQVQLLTRPGCHLCDDALRVLEQHHRWLSRVIVVDVDTDARLQAKYGECIPVVLCDGKVRFKGRVPVALLRRLIEGTPPL